MYNSYKFLHFSHSNLLIAVALFYLLLPCILLSWEIGTILVAILITIGLLFGFISCLLSLYQSEDNTHLFSKKDIFLYVLTLILLLLQMECIGFNLHVSQTPDFIVRNPIYHMLIHEELPLYSARGEYFVYYHAFWLPAAYMVRLFPFLDQELILSVWVFVGLFLAVSLLFLRLKGKVIIFFIITLLMSMPHRCIVNELLARLPKDINDFIYYAFKSFFTSNQFYTSAWDQVTATFNHAIPLAVLLPFFLLKRLPFHILLFASALIVPCTPLGAAAILPLLIGLYVRQICNSSQLCVGKSITMSLLCSPLLVFSAMYFSLAGGAGATFSWSILSPNSNHSITPAQFTLALLSQWLFIWIICLIFDTRHRKMNRYLSIQITIIVFITSFIWMGRKDCNELMFKSGAVLFPVLAFYIFLNRSIRYTSIINKIARILVLLSLPIWVVEDFKYRIIPSYTWEQDKISANKRTEWGNNLDHPEHVWYGSFWTDKLPNPYIFKVREGMKAYVPNDGGKRP